MVVTQLVLRDVLQLVRVVVVPIVVTIAIQIVTLRVQQSAVVEVITINLTEFRKQINCFLNSFSMYGN